MDTLYSAESRSLRSFYRTIFSELTQFVWADKVVPLEDIFEASLEIAKCLKKDLTPYQVKFEYMRRNPELWQNPMDFFDWCKTIRSMFSGLGAGVPTFIGKASMQAIMDSWNLKLEEEQICFCKGLSGHLSEGKGDDIIVEHELASIFLRRKLYVGMHVLHIKTNVGGVIRKVPSDSINPIEWSREESVIMQIEEDWYSLLPFVPAVLPGKKIELQKPHFKKDAIMREFREVFPEGFENDMLPQDPGSIAVGTFTDQK